MLRVEEWLASLGLSEYAGRFAEDDIDTSILRDLTDQDLKDLGVTLGHRRKMLRAIAELDLAASAEPIAQQSIERRQLTVMFCDLVGSTALATRLDPEDLREVIATYQQCCQKVIAQAGGFVASYLGDGVLAYFGYPRAHEDDAECAARASLALVKEVPKLDKVAVNLLHVRIGIATGLVVVGDVIGGGRQKHEVVGETPNLAARLQTMAEPDTIIVDQTTHQILGELFEYRALGSQSIKGFADLIPVWQVTGARPVSDRFEALHATLTPLVDREEEMSLLMRRWQQAKTGNGSVVLISGEAGIGKSRIVRALLERVSGDSHTRIRYFCSPHQQDSPLYPTITQLEHAAAFRREDTAEERLQKLEAVLAQGTDRVKEVAPLFAELLSIPTTRRYPPLELTPSRLKQKIMQAKVAQVAGLATRQPVLMVCEDVHWSDPTSLELLDLIIDRVPTLPLLVIITFRPEFAARWVGYPQVTLLSLNRLAPGQGEEIITYLAAGKALPKGVAEQIIDRTDGVPLFIEELTKAVIETGALASETYRPASGSQLPLAIPTTLRASLLARLDRLQPVREVAQIAAAIGRQFSYELVGAVAKIPQPVLDNALAQLADAELIYRRGAPPDAQYTFKHALVQDAAYESLPRSKRQQYHLQIAQALEQRFSEIAEAQPQILAHHYTEANLGAKAIPYWQAAGQKAVQRSANLEAINHLTRGLELLKAMPESPERLQRELALLVAIGTPLSATKGFASVEVGTIYSRARELCRQAGTSRQLFPALWGLWVFYEARADHKAALELGEQCHRLAEPAGDQELLIAAHHALGVTLMSLGELCASLEHLEQVASIYDPSRHRPRALISNVACRSQAAFVLWLLGRPDQALKKANEALTLAEQLSRPYILAQALVFAAVLYQLLRDQQTAQVRAEAALALSTENEFPFFKAMAMIMLGRASAETSGSEIGIENMRRGLNDFRTAGGEITRPYYLALLSELYDRAGLPKKGLDALSEAQAAIDSSCECCWEAEVLRLKGELMLKQCDGETALAQNQKTAEAYFRDAIEIARRQSAKSWELRATLGLSRLFQTQGKRGQARKILAEIYGWFTEGFDTADLKEAKALLTELS